MEIYYVVIALFAALVLWLVMKPKNESTPHEPIVGGGDLVDENPIGPGEIILPGESSVGPIETPVEVIEEPNRIDDPVPNDPEPTPEMSIKPEPVDCQLAMFKPYPETFRYFDCCGNEFKGEGYQPWEKRSPVPIDALKDFEGMELIGLSTEQSC